MKRPSHEDAQALTSATLAHFGPCTCMRAGSHVVVCGGHDFLHDDPTQRLGVKVWERLLWMRTQRAALLKGEGISTPASVDKLPW